MPSVDRRFIRCTLNTHTHTHARTHAYVIFYYSIIAQLKGGAPGESSTKREEVPETWRDPSEELTKRWYFRLVSSCLRLFDAETSRGTYSPSSTNGVSSRRLGLFSWLFPSSDRDNEISRPLVSYFRRSHWNEISDNSALICWFLTLLFLLLSFFVEYLYWQVSIKSRDNVTICYICS